MKATGLFVLYTVPIGIILALFFALLANEKLKGIGFFRTIYSSTMGISVAASSVIWLFMFNPSMGMFNRMLSLLNLPQIQWLLDPQWALLSVSISTIWMNIGFSFLILLGGLQNIDEHLYESSRIDGAGYFYRLRRITLPMLSPTLFFIITISLINAFQSFGQIDILTQGGPSASTNLIVYSIYREAFINYQFGTASAQAVSSIYHYPDCDDSSIQTGGKEGPLPMTTSLPKKIWIYFLLIVTSFLVFFPVMYAFLISFMTGPELLQGKFLPQSFSLDNYIKVFDRLPLLNYLLNSFIVSVSVMLGQLAVCSLAAYAFVFIPFKGRDFIFFLFISTMMIPWEATMIPN